MKGGSTMIPNQIPNHEMNKDVGHVEQTKTRSSLPSRSEVHRKKKKEKKKRKKSKAKIRFPLIKLLVLFFILLPIVFYFVYVYLQDRPVYKQNSSESVSEQNADQESMISISAEQ
jgi:cell division septal protein FtsQ